MYYVKTPPPPLKKREYFLRCHQKNSCILFGKSQKAAKMVSKGFRIVAVQNPAADAKKWLQYLSLAYDQFDPVCRREK